MTKEKVAKALRECERSLSDWPPPDDFTTRDAWIRAAIRRYGDLREAAGRLEQAEEVLEQWDAYGDHLFRSWLTSERDRLRAEMEKA